MNSPRTPTRVLTPSRHRRSLLSTPVVRVALIVAGLPFPVAGAGCGGGEPSSPRITTSAPPASVGHALVYDDALSQVVLLNAGLGGMDDAALIGRPTRIWSWTGGSWTLLDSLGPPIRNLAGVAYDVRRNVIVMHGGTASRDLNYGETWEWGAGGWAKRSEGGPGVRSHTQMAYDRARGRSVLFGGQNAAGDAFPTDTWEWDGTTWTRTAGNAPPPRVHHAMGFDATSGRVIVFGGTQPGVGDLGDTWAWDGTAWTQLAPAATPRTHAQIGNHPVTGRPVVFGGLTPSGPARSLLSWGQSGWTSTDVDGPTPRYLPAVALDAKRAVLVVYGGGDPAGSSLFSDTWEYDGTRWRRP